MKKIPFENFSGAARSSTKLKNTSSRLSSLSENLASGDDAPFRVRLHVLFSQIEKEFELLYAENLNLQAKLDLIAARNSAVSERFSFQETNEGEITLNKNLKSKLLFSSRLKAGYKLRARTSRIVSSFKAPSCMSSLVRDFQGHKDGVWHVSTKSGQSIIGTASADQTACIWSIDTGRPLLQYQGHSGSVNSIKFHQSREIVLTASGDTTAHVWQAPVIWDILMPTDHSSEQEINDKDEPIEGRECVDILRTPICEFSGLSGHISVVVAADWMSGGDHVITASWDRTAILWDVETEAPIQRLTGHDHELTHVSAHESQRLVATASRDSTFRLWDFREQIPAVSVFQGHSESVTSIVFTRNDKMVSGSDDFTVKVWELRNMRSALTTIRTDAAVNRLDVSPNGIIAIPQDNRYVRLFDLNGQRLGRLRGSSGQGHRRMVSSVAWVDDLSKTCNLFSAGFDRRVLGWSISLPKEI